MLGSESCRKQTRKKVGRKLEILGEVGILDVAAGRNIRQHTPIPFPCMHHRAIRAIPPTANATALTFSALLQAAAGRAWARSASSVAPGPSSSPQKRPKLSVVNHDRQNSNGGSQSSLVPKCVRLSYDVLPTEHLSRSTPFPFPHPTEIDSPTSASLQKRELPPTSSPSSSTSPASQHTLQPSHATLRAQLKHETFVGYFEPEGIQESDLQRADPSRSHADDPLNIPANGQHKEVKGPWCWKDPNLGTFSNEKPLETRSTPIVLPAKSRVALYQNLLYLLSHRDPIPSLPALLDYHDLHTGLRSTRSYNLLVAQALRHASFGTVQWLLKAMQADGLPGNFETWKLKVRWLIQTGWWDRAWNEVMGYQNQNVYGWAPQEKSPIPPEIWLEFFRTLKRAPARRRPMAHGSSETDGRTDSSQVVQAPAELPDTMGLYLARYHVLTANYPVLAPKELARASPRMIYFVVMTMLNSQQSTAALSFTQSYFKALPPIIPANWARICQDIIHLHIALGSSHKGLRKLYESRRTMVSLTKTHSALKPTSTTLLLLLSPLRHAKRCGTVAWNVCNSFKRQWGLRTVDRRVRRRVATLAVKEGRMDIVDKVLSSEKTFRWAHRMWKSTTLTLGAMTTPRPRKLLRSPAKKLFRYNGREERLWHLFRKRTKRMVARRRGE